MAYAAHDIRYKTVWAGQCCFMSACSCAETFGLHMIAKMLQFVCRYQSSRITSSTKLLYLALQLAFVLLVSKHRLWFLHVNVMYLIKCTVGHCCHHQTSELSARLQGCTAGRDRTWHPYDTFSCDHVSSDIKSRSHCPNACSMWISKVPLLSPTDIRWYETRGAFRSYT